MANEAKGEPLAREERVQLPQLHARDKLIDTFKALESKFNPEAHDVTKDPFAANLPMKTHFGFKITEDLESPNDPMFPAHWHIRVKNGRCKAFEGESPAAVIVNEMDYDTLKALCLGEITFTEHRDLIKTMLLGYFNEQLDRLFPRRNPAYWPSIEQSSAFTGFPSGSKDFGLRTKLLQESELPAKGLNTKADVPEAESSQVHAPKDKYSKLEPLKQQPSKHQPSKDKPSSSWPPLLRQGLKAGAVTGLTMGLTTQVKDVDTDALEMANLPHGTGAISNQKNVKGEASKEPPSTARASLARIVQEDKQNKENDDRLSLDFKGVKLTTEQSPKDKFSKAMSSKVEESTASVSKKAKKGGATAADDAGVGAVHSKGTRLNTQQASKGGPWKSKAMGGPFTMKQRMKLEEASGYKDDDDDDDAIHRKGTRHGSNQSSSDESPGDHPSTGKAAEGKGKQRARSSDDLLVGGFEEDWAT